MPGYSANQIADYLIADAHATGSFISNLKLQKLLYYAQAWHLAIYDRPLFEGTFQAWVHGPVLEEIFRRFQKYRWNNIDEDLVGIEIDQDTSDFLQELLEEYGPLDARRLEWLTHREAPWANARRRAGVSDDQACDTPILEGEMRDFYRQRINSPEVEGSLQGQANG